MSYYQSIILDVDSTLSGVEGIDWLASLRGPEVEASISRLTEEAMQGVTPLEDVYGRRLALVNPTLREVEALGQTYISRVATDAGEELNRIRAKGIDIVLMSGGLRQAILPVGRLTGFLDSAVHGVSVTFNDDGSYKAFDDTSPLARKNGKRETAQRIPLKRPILAVGDGMTDYEMKPVVDAFAVYTGFVRRDAVVARADYVLESFQQLAEFVLG